MGFRCVPTRLFTKLEKPLFFFWALPSRLSSLYLCRGLRIPLGSARAIVCSSISGPFAVKFWENRTAGLATAVGRSELNPELLDRKVCAMRACRDSVLAFSVDGRGGGALCGCGACFEKSV